MLTRPSAAAPSAKKSIPSACSSVAASAVELARTKPLLVTRAEATAALGRWAHGQRGLSRRRQQADPTQSGCCLHSLYERAGSAASRSLAGGSRARTAVGRRVTLGTPNVRDLRAAIVQADTCASLNGQQQAAAAQKPPAQAATPAAAGTPAVGSIVNTLPAGCKQEAKGGVEYQRCGNVYYRAAFQGNSLVYVVQQP
jgi:hypothetical protein